MSNPLNYTASQCLAGEPGLLREHAFTRWMSRDLMQAATDFSRNMGLLPLYAETSPQGLTRYLFWAPPAGVFYEIRSGRSPEQFATCDRTNAGKDRSLLSLHISEDQLHSGVWISTPHLPAASFILGSYGITPARRPGV